MAGTTTLVELGRNATVTSSLLRMKVVKVGNTITTTGQNGAELRLMNFALADRTEAILVNCSDSSKFNVIREGKTLHMRNFSIKNNRLTIGTKARVVVGPTLEVGEDQQQKATTLICRPSPQKRIPEALSSKKGEILTVKGSITKVSNFYIII